MEYMGLSEERQIPTFIIPFSHCRHSDSHFDCKETT